MFQPFPKDDPQQALRLRRFFMAFASYLPWTIIIILAHSLGMMRFSNTELFAFIIAAMSINLIFYVVFITGVNKRLKDPSLTTVQMLTGIMWASILAYYSHSSIRGSYIVLYLTVFVFGVFRLTLKEFLTLTVVAVGSYLLSVTLLYLNLADEVDMGLEITRCFLLLAALSWFSPLGHYIYSLREKVVKANTELKGALAKIEQLAVCDELTNIYNRRQLFNILPREKALADRMGSTFVICLMDLDNFKQINDSYGHLAGDAILKKFALTVKNGIRREDYIFRYGGEEFIVIFTGTRHLSDSIETAERIRTSIENLSFPEISDELKITVSIGITVYQHGEPVDVLLSRADDAMYKAKQKGKNRIEYIAPPGPETMPD